MLYLGVDGGMTKTVALVCGADGRISGHARAGSSDVYSATDPALAVGEVARAASAALAAAGGGEPACAYYSLSGADWPADIAYYESELARLVPAARTVVVNDAIGAIRCGADDGVGCSFVCGTGSAIGARARDGRLWHMSFNAAPTFSTDLTPRDARRRRSQRARPAAAEPALRPRGRGIRRAGRDRRDRARDRARSATGARLARRRVARLRLRGRCAGARALGLGGGRGRGLPARGGPQVRPGRADARDAGRRRDAPPLDVAGRRGGRGAAGLRAAAGAARARARGAARGTGRGRRGTRLHSTTRRFRPTSSRPRERAIKSPAARPICEA